MCGLEKFIYIAVCNVMMYFK